MLFADIAATSLAVTGSAGRRDKVAMLAERLAAASPEELPVVVGWLAGTLRQRRTGIGWAGLRDVPSPAGTATLTVADVDAAFEAAATASGTGVQAVRRALVDRLFEAATADEQRMLRGLLTGELRQGAQAGLLLEAIAKASGVPVTAVRRAMTLSGNAAAVAAAASTGGVEALAAFRLAVGRALSPMLASSAPDVAAALADTGPAAVEWKLDGVRVQIHRDGEKVRVFTRSLDDVTDRLPEVVDLARSLPVTSVVLDGEVLAIGADGRPAPFQTTSSRVARRSGRTAAELPLATFVFDVLHVDGTDVLDEDGPARRRVLEGVVPPSVLVPRLAVAGPPDAAAAQEFAAEALARGHEGVVVKADASPYLMGRRGAGWVKVKPRITLDLVVLAVEWGHGRRTGRLSNLHLGARDPDGEYGEPGGFVMLGKTFKGLTDAMLQWQTERLLELRIDDDGWVVRVRPELVVEIAFDGVQTSPRYPAGMALRFARVLAHRPDKLASEADTVATVAGHHAAAS